MGASLERNAGPFGAVVPVGSNQCPIALLGILRHLTAAAILQWTSGAPSPGQYRRYPTRFLPVIGLLFFASSSPAGEAPPNQVDRAELARRNSNRETPDTAIQISRFDCSFRSTPVALGSS
jgi:hypothetical protein